MYKLTQWKVTFVTCLEQLARQYVNISIFQYLLIITGIQHIYINTCPQLLLSIHQYTKQIVRKINWSKIHATTFSPDEIVGSKFRLQLALTIPHANSTWTVANLFLSLLLIPLPFQVRTTRECRYKHAETEYTQINHIGRSFCFCHLWRAPVHVAVFV